MANRVIQAVAGAGKTYYITHNLHKNKRYIFLTFTHGNVKNIETKLNQNSDKPVDTYIQVMTFSKFIIDWFLKPFIPSIFPKLTNFTGDFTTKEPVNDARLPTYQKKDTARHYLTSDGLMFLERISELIDFQNKDYFKKVFARMKLFTDFVVVDEYQDLLGYDFKIVQHLMKQKSVDVTIVGDVYQSNVSKSNVRLKSPFTKIKDEKSLVDFFQRKFGKRVSIDTTSLLKSRRISFEIANFVSEKLNIPIKSKGLNTGSVIKIRDIESLNSLMSTPHHVLINKMVNSGFPYKRQEYLSWSYSKGAEYEDCVVVLTELSEWILSDGKPKELKNMTKNKLYVALTRTCGNLYVVSSGAWKAARLKYCRE